MPEPSSLHRLTEHVYYSVPDSRTDRPSLALVTGTRHTLLLDIGASVAHTRHVLDQAASMGIPAPHLAVLSHWHWDHWFGIAALDVPVIACRETAQQMLVQANYDWSDAALDQRVDAGVEIAFCRDMMKLELPERADLRLRPADIVFDDHLTLDLGGITCQVLHVGGDHASDAVVIHVEEERVLFLSDCMYDAIYSPTRHYTPAGTRAMLGRFAHLPADHYILGHHVQPVPAAEMRGWMDNLLRIGDLVEKYGKERETILAQFATLSGREPNEDDLADVDTFLAGL